MAAATTSQIADKVCAVSRPSIQPFCCVQTYSHALMLHQVLGYDGDYSDYDSGYSRSRYDDGYLHTHRRPRTLRRWSSANSMNGAYLSAGLPAYGAASPYNVATGIVPQVAGTVTSIPTTYAQPGVTVVPGATTGGYLSVSPPTYGIQPASYGYQTGYPVVAGAVTPNPYGGSYVTPGYGAVGYGGYANQVPAGSTIIVSKPAHHHHHRSRSASFSHHHR